MEYASEAHARAIATDIQSIGNLVWKRFNADTNQEQILWYYNSVYEVLSDGGVTPALLNPLQTAIGIMKKSMVD